MPKPVMKLWDKVKQAWQVIAAVISAAAICGAAWADLKVKHENAIEDIAEVKKEIHDIQAKQEVIIRLEEGQKYLIRTVDEIKLDVQNLRPKASAKAAP